MSNNLLTISKITNESLMVLENSLVMADKVDRTYDDQFAVTGAKIGNTVNVRKPPRFIGTTGPALNVEDFNESSVPVTLTTQFHVDTQFTTQDLALSLDKFSDRIIKPTVAAIANKIDRDGLIMAYQSTANLVGTPGTAPTAALTFLQAGAYLDSEGTPRDGNRSLILDPWTQTGIVDSLKGLFNPQQTIGDQYKKGVMAKDTLGFNWYMDQNVVSHTVGPQGGTPVVNGASQGLATGWAFSQNLTTNGWTAAAATRLKKGDVFQIAGVYAVNPQNRQAYGSNKLRNFVVTADAASDGAGNLTVGISPAIIYGGQFQNVTAAPANGAAITVIGTAGTLSPQNLAFHRNAFTLVNADLEMPMGVHFAGRASDKDNGLSIRVVRQYTINNDSLPCRFDVLYGWAPLYPELSCRVAA